MHWVTFQMNMIFSAAPLNSMSHLIRQHTHSQFAIQHKRKLIFEQYMSIRQMEK